MIKNPITRKTIAIFLVLNFLSTIIPYNAIYANNNGPNAPEAAAFEPVDATDMVNLLTGDLTYVLPLLNIPSPEGGYPLALNYHAGIAMEQEASWVGLGWNLNPGAINRNVNGQPDDWGKTSIADFFYDKGWEKNYYSFSLGGRFPNGLSVGLGASWGSDRAFGGMVQLGYGGLNMTYANGKVSSSLSIGLPGGLSFGIDSDLAYSISAKNINNKGIGSTFAEVNVGYRKGQGIGVNVDSKFGLDVSLSSKSGIGTSLFGFSKSGQTSSNVDNEDVFFESNTKNFNVDLGAFWFKYSHTKVEYALFKHDSISATGACYPQLGINTSDNIQEKNTTMDVYTMSMPRIEHIISTNAYYTRESGPYDTGSGGILYGSNHTNMKSNRFIMLNKDSYTVASQGLSGAFSPYIFKEMNLYGGSEEQVQPSHFYEDRDANYNTDYITSNSSHNKTFFYFNSEHSSFLRINRGKLFSPLSNQLDTPSEILNYETEAPDITYNENYTSDGIPLKSNGKKRTGNVIRTFTNEEISEGNLNGFLDAKSENNDRILRNDKSVFLKEGIGAFQITALDGKTYHYSLPVYNFEEFLRSFKEGTDENEAFYQKFKGSPYATHWLLTAITGPDYIDKNNNNLVDKEDYGYYVEFNYGKWSDGYSWRFPKEGFNLYDGKESYSYGRKQLYYLNTIKTRTHTAFFVKDLRLDDKGTELFKGKNKFSSGVFDVLDYTNDYLSRKKKYKNSENNYYDRKGNKVTKKFVAGYWSRYNEYVDIPESYSLKLSEIILLKNENINSSINTKGKALINKTIGNIHVNSGIEANISSKRDLFYSDNNVTSFENHFSENIYDINDNISSLRDKSIKSIKFNYDYKLASNTPTSESSNQGRLTLNNVMVNGKFGRNVMPGYNFSYINEDDYNKDNINDWGYYKDKPEQWSLNEVETPTGAKIKINYESDSFYTEAAFKSDNFIRGREFNYYSPFLIERDSNKANDMRVLEVVKEENDLLRITFAPKNINEGNYFLKDNFKVDGECEIIAYRKVGSIVSENKAIVEKIDQDIVWLRLKENIGNQGDLKNFLINICQANDGGDNCISKINVVGIDYDRNLFTTEYNPDGKKGGGIRVASIQTLSNDNTIADEIKYSYTNHSNNYTSGVTTYVPSNNQGVITYMSEIPTPRVYYKNVTVYKEDNNSQIISGTRYNFETFDNAKFFKHGGNSNVLYSLGNLLKVKWNSGDESVHPGIGNGFMTKELSNYSIENKMANLGRLLSKEDFNSKNQVVGKLVNNYKENLDAIDEIGVTQETFRNSRRYTQDVWNENQDVIGYYVSLSSKVNYPSVIESTDRIIGNNKVTTYFDKHDFLTGQVLESRIYSSNGKAFKNKIIPAYGKYTTMGSKVDDNSNRNMLTQSAGIINYMYKNNQWKEVGATITTWNNDWEYRSYDGSKEIPTNENEMIWRKHKNYLWNGNTNNDGTYIGFNSENEDNFQWELGANQINSDWREVSETTLYNHFSNPLEVKDINGNYAASKMTGGGKANERVLVSSNARYTEMYYSGAEDGTSIPFLFSGEVGKGAIELDNITVSEEKVHTGKKSLVIGSTANGFIVEMSRNEHRSGKYKVSVWVEKLNENKARISFDGTIKHFNGEKVYAGDWVQLNHYEDLLDVQDYTIGIRSSSGLIYADDFRLHPISSSMSSYVYNEWDEVSYIMGANGLSTHYIYDAAGRLIETQVETIDKVANDGSGGFKKVATNSYNYKRNNQ